MNERDVNEAIRKATPVLLKGDRVELIPEKDGRIKVVSVHRKPIKN